MPTHRGKRMWTPAEHGEIGVTGLNKGMNQSKFATSEGMVFGEGMAAGNVDRYDELVRFKSLGQRKSHMTMNADLTNYQQLRQASRGPWQAKVPHMS